MSDNLALAECLENVTATMATGCVGAGQYREVFRQMGYAHLEVMDWTSSAGDWWFIVSEDGKSWYNAGQENRWPRSGFEYSVDKSIRVEGSAEDAVEVFWEMANG